MGSRQGSVRLADTESVNAVFRAVFMSYRSASEIPAARDWPVLGRLSPIGKFMRSTVTRKTISRVSVVAHSVTLPYIWSHSNCQIGRLDSRTQLPLHVGKGMNTYLSFALQLQKSE
jgi:hypothetical protein